jgi:hypothetical protein
VNGYLRKNVEYVIKRFESQDLTSIVELKMLLDNVQTTHSLLADSLPLDPWESIYREINHCTATGRFRGRITWHIFTELMADIIPAYIFNDTTNRFVVGADVLVEQPERERPPRGIAAHAWYGKGFYEAFNRISALHRGYFGMEHLEAMLEVLGPKDTPLLINEIVTEMANKLKYDMAPYVSHTHTLTHTHTHTHTHTYTHASTHTDA